MTKCNYIYILKFITVSTRPVNWISFAVFIEKFLCPQLWPGAVVVMDNLPAHKLASIEPMIQSVGASVICLSPYSPDFNPIEREVVATQIFFAEVRSHYHFYD